MTTNRIIAIILVIGLLALIAWLIGQRTNFLNFNTSPSPTPFVATTPTPSPSRQVVVNLTELNNSGESGTALLREENGKAIVDINLEGVPENVRQPAHIHTGSCNDLGSIKYPLSEITNGTSSTSLNVSLNDLLNQLPLAVNVHRSAQETSIYVACGDIQRPQWFTPSGSATPSVSPTGSPTTNPTATPTRTASPTPTR